jgi:CRISPR-associated endonuclease/helicase Cas3
MMNVISSSFELISHPDRTLLEHLDSCGELSARMLKHKYVAPSFYTKENIDTWRKYLVYFHDLGKGTDFFQKRIIDALLTEAITDTEIADFQAIMQDYLDNFALQKAGIAANLLTENQRLGTHARLGAHLVLLFLKNDDAIVEYIISKVIRRHHGNLTNFLKDKDGITQLVVKADDDTLKRQLDYLNLPLYNQILEMRLGHTLQNDMWNELIKRFKIVRAEEVADDLEDAKTLKYFFLQHYLFSLLLSADKGDMMLPKDGDKADFLKPTEALPANIITNYKTILFGDTVIKAIDIKREAAFQDIAANCKKYGHQSFFSITLPTGMGKTFCAFNAAVLLQKAYADQTGVSPKIIYCLPFTSIIDQNAAILEDILQKQAPELIDRMTRHHYLAGYKDMYDETKLQKDEAEYLTVGWEHDIIVTTFVQFLESIFTNKNRVLRKFHNMTNAIIVLDEVQNIPPAYFKAVEAVFKSMADYFGTKFVFVTATQPFLFKDANDVIELTDSTFVKTKQYFEDLDRICIDQSILKSIENDEEKAIDFQTFTDILTTDISSNVAKSFLIICNTISYSQNVYHTLKEAFPDAELLYLSGSILPIKRKEVIAKVQKNIKNKRNGIETKQMILVTTQVVEAGVDIDLDIVYRDFAPLDSINQSAGRCNRNGINAEQGIVKLFNSGKGKAIYDATLLDITDIILKKRDAIIPEADLYEINRAYAKAVRDKVAANSDVSNTLIKAMERLNLETVNDNFKLIDDNYPKYDVFIPYCDNAKAAWAKYIAACKVADDFDRKRAIKKIKPDLLQYVTRFPKNQYNPSKEEDKDKPIIKEDLWEHYYDLEFGFIPKKENEIAFL